MALVDTITIDTVQSRPVDWLWEGYIPLGTVTVLLGDGGQGKSFMSLAIAATVTNGEALPSATSALPPSDVIVQNAENPIATVVKPRLELLGADCGKIHIINEADKRLTMTDERIEQAIIQHGAKLVVIDPVQSYLGDKFSMNRAESVRLVLTQLEQVAERTNCAILLVGHLNKGRGKANYRGLSSVDIFNSVPSVLYLGKIDDDEEVRAVVHGKSNLGELAASQAFRLSKADGFEWMGECDVTLDELLNSKAGGGHKLRLEEACEFLRDILSDGGVLATEVIEQAEMSGISKITLERAKAAVGVKSSRVDGHWVWKLGNDKVIMLVK
jgi:archaellum biogenesis ATPase FlaH